MNNEFFQTYLRVSVSQIALICRFNKMKMSAVALLGNLTYYYIRKCGLAIKRHNDEYGLQSPEFDDAVLALEGININIDDLMHFFRGNRGFSYLHENIPMIIPTADRLDLPELEEMQQLTFNGDQDYDKTIRYTEECDMPKKRKIAFVVNPTNSTQESDSEHDVDDSPKRPNHIKIKFNVSTPPIYHENKSGTSLSEEEESSFDESACEQHEEECETDVLAKTIDDEVLSSTFYLPDSHEEIQEKGSLND